VSKSFLALVEGLTINATRRMTGKLWHYPILPVHQTLRVTPAMEARLADCVWAMEDLINLIDTGTAEMVA
jgi:hypothetical protein